MREVFSFPRSAAPAPFERRRCRRYTAAGKATVSWPSGSGGECISLGRIQDVSAEGLGIQLSKPLVIGQVVRIYLERTDLQACIRSCRRQGTAFVAGLKILN